MGYKTVLHSGFHDEDSGFPGAGFKSVSVELEFWILILRRILDSLSCIPDSKAQDSGFHKQKFLGFQNPHGGRNPCYGPRSAFG